MEQKQDLNYGLVVTDDNFLKYFSFIEKCILRYKRENVFKDSILQHASSPTPPNSCHVYFPLKKTPLTFKSESFEKY